MQAPKISAHKWSGHQAAKSRPIQKMNGTQIYCCSMQENRLMKKMTRRKMRHHVKMLSLQEFNEYYYELQFV